MGDVLRRLFTLASAVSLLLLVLTAVLWVRSYYVSDHLAYNTADLDTYRCTMYRAQTVRGIVFLQHALRVFTTREAVEMFRHDVPMFDEEIGFCYSTDEPTRLVEERISESNSLLASLGFWGKTFTDGPRGIARARPIRKQVGTITIHGASLSFPLWFPAGLFALPAVVWLMVALRRRTRRRLGHCPICSYDLTGNKSGICPECGRPVRVAPVNPPSA